MVNILNNYSRSQAFPLVLGKAEITMPGTRWAVLASEYLHEFINVCKMFANLKLFQILKVRSLHYSMDLL